MDGDHDGVRTPQVRREIPGGVREQGGQRVQSLPARAPERGGERGRVLRVAARRRAAQAGGRSGGGRDIHRRPGGVQRRVLPESRHQAQGHVLQYVGLHTLFTSRS